MNVIDGVTQYTIEHDLAPIIAGVVPVPNFQKRESIVVVKTTLQHRLMMDAVAGFINLRGRKSPAWFYLKKRNGHFDGSGYVIYAGLASLSPESGTFAICDHEQGGDPPRCKRCGMLMEKST